MLRLRSRNALLMLNDALVVLDSGEYSVRYHKLINCTELDFTCNLSTDAPAPTNRRRIRIALIKPGEECPPRFGSGVTAGKVIATLDLSLSCCRT